MYEENITPKYLNYSIPEFDTPLMKNLRNNYLETLREMMLDLARLTYKSEQVIYNCGVGSITLTFYGHPSITEPPSNLNR